MKIQFLYYEDCPSHEAGQQRLQQVMAELGLQTPVEVIKVETEAEATRWGFIGSPTILIDGVDIDPPPSGTPPALTCRAYLWQNGRFSPLPSPALIRRALTRALANTQSATEVKS
ncbi:MAG: hypothetical protein GXP37_11840 [Chloroflexi bacterium]|nr:hypothetical protein [Chloroflexota bacterium]